MKDKEKFQDQNCDEEEDSSYRQFEKIQKNREKQDYNARFEAYQRSVMRGTGEESKQKNINIDYLTTEDDRIEPSNTLQFTHTRLNEQLDSENRPSTGYNNQLFEKKEKAIFSSTGNLNKWDQRAANLGYNDTDMGRGSGSKNMFFGPNSNDDNNDLYQTGGGGGYIKQVESDLQEDKNGIFGISSIKKKSSNFHNGTQFSFNVNQQNQQMNQQNQRKNTQSFKQNPSFNFDRRAERMSNSSQKLLGGSQIDGFRESITSRSNNGDNGDLHIPSVEKDGLLGIASHVLNSKVLNRFQNAQPSLGYSRSSQDDNNLSQSQSSSRRSYNHNNSHQEVPLVSNRYINEYQQESSRLNSQRAKNNNQLQMYQESLSSQRGYNYTDSNTKRDLGQIRERTTHEMMNYQPPKERETLDDDSQLDFYQEHQSHAQRKSIESSQFSAFSPSDEMKCKPKTIF